MNIQCGARGQWEAESKRWEWQIMERVCLEQRIKRDKEKLSVYIWVVMAKEERTKVLLNLHLSQCQCRPEPQQLCCVSLLWIWVSSVFFSIRNIRGHIKESQKNERCMEIIKPFGVRCHMRLALEQVAWFWIQYASFQHVTPHSPSLPALWLVLY